MNQSIILCVFLLAIAGIGYGGYPYPSSLLVSDDVETSFFEDDTMLVHRHGPIVSFARQKIETTADIIQLLETLPPSPLVEKVIEILRVPEVQKVVDNILRRYPQLPSVIRGIRLFLTGPEAKPLMDALKTVVPQLAKALIVLYEKIKGPLEETAEVFVEEGVKLFFLLQSPEVIEVIDKFQKLPEVLLIADHLKAYDFDLIAAIEKLKQMLQ